jgi:hypothetical protein
MAKKLRQIRLLLITVSLIVNKGWYWRVSNWLKNRRFGQLTEEKNYSAGNKSAGFTR